MRGTGEFTLIRLAYGQPPSPVRGKTRTMAVTQLHSSLDRRNDKPSPLMGEGGTAKPWRMRVKPAFTSTLPIGDSFITSLTNNSVYITIYLYNKSIPFYRGHERRSQWAIHKPVCAGHPQQWRLFGYLIIVKEMVYLWKADISCSPISWKHFCVPCFLIAHIRGTAQSYSSIFSSPLRCLSCPALPGAVPPGIVPKILVKRYFSFLLPSCCSAPYCFVGGFSTRLRAMCFKPVW